MIQYYDVMRAGQLARIAMRRGDLDAAERWFRLADRAVTMVQKLTALEAAEKRKTPVRNPI